MTHKNDEKLLTKQGGPESPEALDKQQAQDKINEVEKEEKQDLAEDLNGHDGLTEKEHDIIVNERKEEYEDLTQVESDKSKLLENLRSAESISKSTEWFGRIMDTYGLKVILSWVVDIPGEDFLIDGVCLMFFIYWNSKLPDEYKLDRKDKAKIFSFQAIDAGAKTVVKLPTQAVKSWLNSIPFVGWLLKYPIDPLMNGIEAVTTSVVDYVIKANKWSSEIFQKHIEEMKDEVILHNLQAPANDRIEVTTLNEQSQQMQEAMNTVHGQEAVDTSDDKITTQIKQERAKKLVGSLEKAKSVKEQVDTFALWMDGKYGVGIDSISGLVPVVWDAGSSIISTVFFLYQAQKIGLPLSDKLKIIGNETLDALAGCIPVLGDAIDAWGIHANRRNAELFGKYYDKLKDEAVLKGVNIQETAEIKSEQSTWMKALEKIWGGKQQKDAPADKTKQDKQEQEDAPKNEKKSEQSGVDTTD